MNTIPEAFRDDAGRFLGPRLSDGAGSGSLGSSLSPPDVGVTPDGAFRTTFGVGSAARITPGGEARVDAPQPLGDDRGVGDANPVVEVAETEAWVAAWRARRALVGVHEQRVDGKPVVKGVAAASGGAVQDVQIASSGLGDAIVGLLQGDPGRTQVAAAAVDSPPLEFAVQVPLSFVRSRKVKLTWDPARNALGRVRYTVSVGKRVLARDLDRTSLRFRTKRLKDGRLDVKVTARDRLGQRISSTEAVLRLDRKPPRVSAAALWKAPRADQDRGRQAAPCSGAGAIANLVRRRQARSRHTRRAQLQAPGDLQAGRVGTRPRGEPQAARDEGAGQMRPRRDSAVVAGDRVLGRRAR